jgi:hypothetical protein
MKKKPVTYTIPEQLDAVLHAKIGRGRMSQFVTQALWEALKREEDALLMEFLEADKDPGNIEVKKSFSRIEGEDFIGLDDFDLKDHAVNER